ncbi:MAG: putative Ig domain-containing protein [Acidobacteria bacterium]|nr:putative Ig domain-containing protein [Acidobacteriota bacterium]
MNAKSARTLTVFLAAACLVLFCAVSGFAVRVVDRADDAGDPVNGISACTAAANDCTLRGAVAGSGPGDTIMFDPSLNGQTITVATAIHVSTNNLNFVGPGAGLLTIRNTANDYIFTFGVDLWAMSGLTLANSAGGIYWITSVSPNHAVLDSVVFDHIKQTAPLTSGLHAVYNSRGTMDIKFCVFSNDDNIDNQNFLENRGAAIQNDSTLNVINSLFVSNHSQFEAAALYNTGTATVADSQFENNAAFLDGGAIMNDGAGVLTVQRSEITGNTARDGGAIVDVSGTGKVTVRESFIGTNTATVGIGGAISGNQKLNLINDTFSGNTAATNGGAVDLEGSPAGNAYIRHVTMTANTANNGGGIFVGGAAVNIANSIVTGNTAPTNTNTTATGSNNIIGGNAGLGRLGSYGGTTSYPLTCGSPAINAGNNSLSFDDGGFAITTDQRTDGAFFFPSRNVGGTVDIGAFEADNAAVSNISDDASTAGSLRSAIASAGFGSSVCFDSAFFSTPQTILMSAGDMVINKSLTIGGPGSGLLTIDPGQSSRAFDVDPTGGYYVNISGMTLTDGLPGGLGGLLIARTGVVNLSNDVFSNTGTTNSYGGCIYNKSAAVNLTDSTVSSCIAGAGGGVANDKTMTTTRSLFTGNSSRQGGAVYNTSNLTVKDSTFTSNSATAPSGSGSAPEGGAIFNAFTGAITGSTFTGNTAQWGGAIYNAYYTSIQNSTFSNNGAIQTNNGDFSVDGGAIYAGGNYTGGAGGVIDITNLTVAGNHSAGRGGGVFLKQDTSTAYINTVNSIYALNTAASGAGPDVYGGMFSYGSNVIGNNNSQSYFPNSPVFTGNQNGTAANPIDPHLAPIANYGGPTQTFALLSNSTALNAGRTDYFLPTDQRGQVRPRESVGDIGAYERSVTVDQSSLHYANQGIAYSKQLSFTRQTSLAEGPSGAVQGPQAGTSWSIVPNAGEGLPPGITLSSSGLVSGTPTTQGTYTFTVKPTDSDGMSGVQRLSINVLSPTAAEVGLSGRVLTSLGSGMRGARVVLTLPDGSKRTAISNSFGYYSIDGIAAGTTLVISVEARAYRFSPQIVTLVDSLTDHDLIVSQ